MTSLQTPPNSQPVETERKRKKIRSHWLYIAVIVLLSATKAYASAWPCRGRAFAAHAAFYPALWSYNRAPGHDFRDLTGAPVLIQAGGADAYDDPEACARRFLARCSPGRPGPTSSWSSTRAQPRLRPRPAVQGHHRPLRAQGRRAATCCSSSIRRRPRPGADADLVAFLQRAFARAPRPCQACTARSSSPASGRSTKPRPGWRRASGRG